MSTSKITDKWDAAVRVARECGAEAARQNTRPIPVWTGEPILYADWDAIVAALGTDPSNVDSVANQELIDAWVDGYGAARAEENTDLQAEWLTDGWTVVDPRGGRWWPDARAVAEISASDEPAATAIAICDTDPLRGEWYC